MQKQYQAHAANHISKYETVMQNVTSSSDFKTSGGIHRKHAKCVCVF